MTARHQLYFNSIVFHSNSLSSAKVNAMDESNFSNWSYGTSLESEYKAGRALQSCDPSQSDWLSNLQLDLRAASARRKTVHCIVANTETWYVSIFCLFGCFIRTLCPIWLFLV